MAVKRPPDTWVSQVLTLKGFVDNVYSEIDGSLVGYIKDGKFVQTIDELPKLDPKKKKEQDPGYVARLKESQALLAINILKQSAPYYKELAEDIKQTPAKRAEAKAKLDDINKQIEVRSKEAGVAVAAKAKIETEQKAKDAGPRAEAIKAEYKKLQAQINAVLDPKDPKIARIKAQQEKLVNEYKSVYSNVLKIPVSLTAARLNLQSSAPSTGTKTSKTTSTGPTGAQGPTGAPITKIPPVVSGNAPSGIATGPSGIKGASGPSGPSGPTGSSGPTGLTGSSGPSGATGSSGPSGATGASGPSGPSGAVSSYDKLLAEVKEKYNLPDIIFSNVKSLGLILQKYINGEIDLERFKQDIQNDAWYRQNSTEIKARYLQKFNYEDLVKSGRAQGTTDYEMQIAKITNSLVSKARELGSVLDEGQAKLIAEDLYIYNQDTDDAVVTRRLVNFIRPMAGMIAGNITEDYSGLALKNYQGLQAIAKANGFRIEDILPRGIDGKPATAQETLKRIALGEIDPTRLEQDVRKLAAVGQPQFVRDLLGQGINLDAIYSPYRQTMSRVLELDEGQISLTDPTLRMGINEKGDINLYDYEKALRKDSRWQYTGDARDKVSNAAMTVLRNFGFQG